jgi:hypothetical protein
VHDLPGTVEAIDLLWRVYHGTLRPTTPSDQGRATATMTALGDKALVNGLLITYHNMYGLHLPKSLNEPTFTFRSDLVTTDPYGSEVSSIEGYTFTIRERFRASYMAAQPNVGDVFGTMFASRDKATGAVNSDRLWGNVFTEGLLEAFILRYQSSPSVLEHLEANLERAVRGAPLVERPVPSEHHGAVSEPFALPWEPARTGVLAREPIPGSTATWTRPERWTVTAGNASIFNIGEPAFVQMNVWVTDGSADLLKRANFLREFQKLTSAPTICADHCEVVQADGRDGYLFVFEAGLRAHFLLQAGDATLQFTLIGGGREPFLRALGEFRTLIRSIRVDADAKGSDAAADLAQYEHMPADARRRRN